MLQSAPTPAPRYLGIDLLRALLILEGVFYHASLVVAPTAADALSNPRYNSYSIALFFHFFHLFRMELFFLISGFFSSLIMERKGLEHFIENRRRRVFEPLLWGVILITAPQYLWLKSLYPGTSGLAYIVMHLWFMLTLTFISLLYIFYRPIFNSLARLTPRRLVVLALAFGMASRACGYLSRFPDTSFLLVLSWVFHYAIFFIFGKSIYITGLKPTSKQKILLILSACMCTPALIFHQYLVYEYHNFPNLPLFYRAAKSVLYETVLLINATSISLLLFEAARNIAEPQINRYRKLAEGTIQSALVIYILHIPTLILFNHFLGSTDLNTWQFFLALSTLSLTIPLAIYFIFRRFWLFRYLYGITKYQPSRKSRRGLQAE